MAYSGKYKVKNIAKYKGDYTNVIFRSNWEKVCFKWCDQNDSILEWSSEETIIPYFYEVDKRVHRYFMDLRFKTKDGKTYLVEIKPHKQTLVPKNPNKSKRYITESLTYIKNRCKWKAAESYSKDRGWHFEIWTEHTLQKMGLLPKLKPLGKLKPLAPFRKKSINRRNG
jgi:hypothetical protein|tara:strand:- start:3362 stop:3868 length:507 start_codon:yes stop_codon:yes gene_type:complete